MSSVLTRSSIRYSIHHPWQLALSLLGIALGVAVVVSVDLSSVSAERAFAASNRSVLGSTTHQIVGASSDLAEELYAIVKTLARPGAAAPAVEGTAIVEGIDGRAFVVLGIDPLAEAPLRSHLRRSTSRDENPFWSLLSERNTALLAESVVDFLGLSVGQAFAVRIDGRTQLLRLAGVLNQTGELEVAQSSNLLVVDISTAQTLFSKFGKLSRIDLVLPESSAGEAAAERVGAVLPSGVRLVSSPARTRATFEMTRAFRLNLTMLSLLALLVGMFLIYNTMSFSVVQRHALIGNLRTLGVTRKQIFTLILVEALMLGLIGALAGVVIGLALATELVKLVTRTINDLYFVVEVTEVTIPWLLLAKGMLLGGAASVAAAAVPAFAATRVTPRLTQMRSTAESTLHAWTGKLAVFGGLLLVLSLVLVFVPTRHLGPGFVALFIMVLGFALLTPLLVKGFVRLMKPASRLFSTTLGPLAVRGVSSSLSRSAVAIAALMVALATTVGVGVMVDSFRHSLAEWLRVTLQADIYVSVAGPGGGFIDDPIVHSIRGLEGVRELSYGSAIEVHADDGPVEVIAIQMAAASYAGFRFVEGEPESAWRGFDQDGQVLVTEPYAWHHAAQVGDVVHLDTDSGPTGFQIAGVVRDYGSERGAVFMSRETFESWWQARKPSTLGVYVHDGVDLESLVTRIEQTAGTRQAIYVRSNKTIRTASMVVFERTFTITTVLQILATAIAFVGVLSALMAISLERQREVAVLRALGMSKGQVWNVIATQTGLMGLLAGVLCLPLGLAMAVMLIDVINRRSFGWGIDLLVEPAGLARALLLAIAAALLAGLYPALRMTSSEPALALRED